MHAAWDNGREFILQGEIEKALAAFSEALNHPKDAFNPGLWNDFGVALFCDGQTALAIGCFERSILLSSYGWLRGEKSCPDAVRNLSTARYKQSRR